MPLPSQKYGAHQCTAKSKRSGVRCLNNAVKGASICRMHGYVPKDKIRCGDAHGMYKDGSRTLEAQEEASRKLCELRYLEDLGHAIGIMGGNKTKGAKPHGYIKFSSINKIKEALK